jgi:hypothetical protein
MNVVFTMALQSNPPPDWDPIDYQQVNKDVEALYRAGEGKLGTDEVRPWSLLLTVTCCLVKYYPTDDILQYSHQSFQASFNSRVR